LNAATKLSLAVPVLDPSLKELGNRMAFIVQIVHARTLGGSLYHHASYFLLAFMCIWEFDIGIHEQILSFCTCFLYSNVGSGAARVLC
jgi:hypothetical protein